MDLDEYISKLKSESATPGGGSAAAITSMFSASLNSMASLLSIGRKKLEVYRKQFENISGDSGIIIENLRKLSREDEDSFQGIMNALHIDKEDPGRRNALDMAIKRSISVSWRIAGISMENLNNSLFLCIYGNKNLITDSISAAYLSYTAIHTSVNNIKINLKLQKDMEYRYGEMAKLNLFMEAVENSMNSIREIERGL
jgi:formiminotetrahydrofolate cyclodeaminase